MVRNIMMSAIWLIPYEFRRLLYRITLPQSNKIFQKMRMKDADTNEYSLKPYDEYKCIFIHIPKCAGVSLCKSLFGNLAGSHLSVARYQLIYNKEEFDAYFKFTFVRNPWDRLVSAYFFLKRGGFEEKDKIWAKKNLSKYTDFDSFVHAWVNKKNIQKWNHFKPQYRWICEPGSNIPKVDFIGYFENIEKDYSFVKSKIGSNSKLKHYNRSARNKKDYREYYTEATKEIVADVYKEDIRLFGYEFGGTLPKNTCNIDST